MAKTPDKELDGILASIRKIVVEDSAIDSADAQAFTDIDEALLDPDFDTLPLSHEVGAEISATNVPNELAIDPTVRALLQPMLKAWLDANLPEIVEAAVAAEIRRLTGHG